MSAHAPALPRPSGRRGVAAWSGALVVAAVLATAAPAAAADVPARQPLVILTDDHVARTRPGVHAPRLETVAARRPLTRRRTTLPVLAYGKGPGGRRWVRVRLPGRPNGRTGWIPAAGTRSAATAWHLVVELRARRVTAYFDGRRQRRFRAVVGKPSTPTPRGTFFVEESVALAAADAGGPFALALSARSAVLQEFNGGPGQIALHGTNRLPDPPGTAASHGCVRLSPRAITWLARRIGPGVPLTVTR